MRIHGPRSRVARTRNTRGVSGSRRRELLEEAVGRVLRRWAAGRLHVGRQRAEGGGEWPLGQRGQREGFERLAARAGLEQRLDEQRGDVAVRDAPRRHVATAQHVAALGDILLVEVARAYDAVRQPGGTHARLLARLDPEDVLRVEAHDGQVGGRGVALLGLTTPADARGGGGREQHELGRHRALVAAQQGARLAQHRRRAAHPAPVLGGRRPSSDARGRGAPDHRRDPRRDRRGLFGGDDLDARAVGLDARLGHRARLGLDVGQARLERCPPSLAAGTHAQARHALQQLRHHELACAARGGGGGGRTVGARQWAPGGGGLQALPQRAACTHLPGSRRL
eukprot:scaffold29678_cov57-Phaeocystis_antarctica.AAC.1